MSNERINKYLSSAGVASRRKVDALIEKGVVKINGKVAEIGQVVDTEKDIVTVEGKEVKQQEEKVYFMINKPSGVLTAASDYTDRKLIVDLIKTKHRVFPIGRLDFETEGLLILTNDGELFNKIIHPKSEVFKKYYAKVVGLLTEQEAEKLRKGINLKDGLTLPAKVKVLKTCKDFSEVEIEIREGRNRQVRRMFDFIKHEVIYLKRIAIGELGIGNLKKGEYRELSKKELEYLSNM